jgi:hypothetical protein
MRKGLSTTWTTTGGLQRRAYGECEWERELTKKREKRILIYIIFDVI